MTAVALMTLALSCLGFTLLALDMDRHTEVLTGREQLSRRLRVLLRLAALALAWAGLSLCLEAWGAVVGVVVWAGLLSLAAVLCTLMLSFTPRMLMPVAAASVALFFCLSRYQG